MVRAVAPHTCIGLIRKLTCQIQSWHHTHSSYCHPRLLRCPARQQCHMVERLPKPYNDLDWTRRIAGVQGEEVAKNCRAFVSSVLRFSFHAGEGPYAEPSPDHRS